MALYPLLCSSWYSQRSLGLTASHPTTNVMEVFTGEQKDSLGWAKLLMVHLHVYRLELELYFHIQARCIFVNSWTTGACTMSGDLGDDLELLIFHLLSVEIIGVHHYV